MNDSLATSASAAASRPRLEVVALPEHRPCLAFAPDRVIEMRRMRETYRWARHAYYDAVRSAERIDKPTPAGGDDDWLIPPMPATDKGRGRQNFVAAFHAAMIGYLDDDANYIEQSRQLLEHALEHDTTIWWQPVSLRIVCAVDGLWPHLTGAQRVRFETLLRAAFDRGPDFSKSQNNIGVGHRKAMLGVGIVLNDLQLIDAALNDPDYGAVRQMRNLILDDGIWNEASVGYQAYGMLQFAEIAWLCDRINVPFKELFNHRLRRGCEALFGLLDAQCNLPAIGDTARGGLEAQAASALQEMVAALFDHPWAGWAVRRTSRCDADCLAFGAANPPSAPPPAKSRLFPDGGVAALRAGEMAKFWDSDSPTAFLRFGPYGGWHGHLDGLQLELRAYGREMVTARRRANAYADRTHHRWHQTTLSHSTVVVDGKPQQIDHDGGRCIDFVQSPTVSATCAQQPGVYPGLRYERAVVLTDRYLIDSFRAADDAPHVYHYILYGTGMYTCDRPMTRLDGLGCDNGYEFLCDIRAADVDGPWRAVLEQGGFKGDKKAWRPSGTNMTVRSLNTIRGRLIFAGCFDGATLGVEDCLIAETKASAAHFLTLLEPHREQSAITSTQTHDGDATICVTIHFAGGRDVVCYAPHDKAAVQIDGVTFDGQFLLARFDETGQHTHVVARDARHLRIGDTVLIEDKSGRDLDLENRSSER